MYIPNFPPTTNESLSSEVSSQSIASSINSCPFLSTSEIFDIEENICSCVFIPPLCPQHIAGYMRAALQIHDKVASLTGGQEDGIIRK